MDNGSTVSAINKIQVPDFTRLMVDALKNAGSNAWIKLGWSNKWWFEPAIYITAGLIIVALFMFFYVKIIR